MNVAQGILSDLREGSHSLIYKLPCSMRDVLSEDLSAKPYFDSLEVHTHPQGYGLPHMEPYLKLSRVRVRNHMTPLSLSSIN